MDVMDCEVSNSHSFNKFLSFFRMWFILVGLFFVTCICTANPAANRRIYSTVLNQNKWVKHLENPCRAPIDSQTNQTRLTMEGRQAEIRIMAGNMKSRLGLIKSHLVSKSFYISKFSS